MGEGQIPGCHLIDTSTNTVFVRLVKTAMFATYFRLFTSEVCCSNTQLGAKHRVWVWFPTQKVETLVKGPLMDISVSKCPTFSHFFLLLLLPSFSSPSSSSINQVLLLIGLCCGFLLAPCVVPWEWFLLLAQKRNNSIQRTGTVYWPVRAHCTVQ